MKLLKVFQGALVVSGSLSAAVVTDEMSTGVSSRNIMAYSLGILTIVSGLGALCFGEITASGREHDDGGSIGMEHSKHYHTA